MCVLCLRIVSCGLAYEVAALERPSLTSMTKTAKEETRLRVTFPMGPALA